jgi:hypothetical protein
MRAETEAISFRLSAVSIYFNFEGEESRTYHQTSSSFLRLMRAGAAIGD